MSIRGKRISPAIIILFNVFTNIKLAINTTFKKYCIVSACMCVRAHTHTHMCEQMQAVKASSCCKAPQGH